MMGCIGIDQGNTFVAKQNTGVNGATKAFGDLFFCVICGVVDVVKNVSSRTKNVKGLVICPFIGSCIIPGVGDIGKLHVRDNAQSTQQRIRMDNFWFVWGWTLRFNWRWWCWGGGEL